MTLIYGSQFPTWSLQSECDNSQIVQSLNNGGHKLLGLLMIHTRYPLCVYDRLRQYITIPASHPVAFMHNHSPTSPGLLNFFYTCTNLSLQAKRIQQKFQKYIIMTDPGYTMKSYFEFLIFTLISSV